MDQRLLSSSADLFNDIYRCIVWAFRIIYASAYDDEIRAGVDRGFSVAALGTYAG
jgi:hypothetical protein